MPTKRRAERDIVRSLRLERAARGVDELRRATVAAEDEFGTELDLVAAENRESAENLVHYLGVRRLDIRELQDELARLGLSSLGRMEAHVIASLDAVADVLQTLRGQPPDPHLRDAPPITFETGSALLLEHANAVLGAPPPGLHTRVMVTMPGEAADEPRLIRALVEAGMGIMRINCAHDDSTVWKRMVTHLRRAERDTGRRCLVSFDLAGPKLRTGPIAPGPAVMRWRPKRDALGRVLTPARVRLAAAIPDGSDDTIPVSASLISAARPGDTIVFTDTRRRKRVLHISEVAGGVCTCGTDTTAYVVPGLALALRRRGRIVAKGVVGALPAQERAIELHAGDTLDLIRGAMPGDDAAHDAAGRVITPASIGCALPEVFAGVRVGEPILFDDGKIRGVIRSAAEDRLRISITSIVGHAAKLRAEKGINLPESDLALPALTDKDLTDLDFVVRHGDMVAMSFVQHPDDVAALLAALAARKASQLGIVLKIETRAAFERLPALLLAAMRHRAVAVMVARGDLGVEVGFERLSEVQEEILWICEAAHVPVIWATQVLESLAKGGLPSRAEVTDAGMGSRAECVMLNKGPYILETLRFLVDVLARMEEHQYKKTARLRRLRVSGTRPPPTPPGSPRRTPR